MATVQSGKATFDAWSLWRPDGNGEAEGVHCSSMNELQAEREAFMKA